jgi:hypothetical protein
MERTTLLQSRDRSSALSTRSRSAPTVEEQRRAVSPGIRRTAALGRRGVPSLRAPVLSAASPRQLLDGGARRDSRFGMGAWVMR